MRSRVVSAPLLTHKQAPSAFGSVMRSIAVSLLFAALPFHLDAAAPPKQEVVDPNAPVSYWKQIRPIFQAQCQGCHQPAKSKGGYVMTEFTRLIAGGESGEKAIIAGKPEASLLIDSITLKDGEAEMPKDKTPLDADHVALIRRWVAEGAVDDTPKNAVQRYDQEHPPVYQRPPVVTSLDYSSDGKLLAVAGFHEVLLNHADGSGIVARLIGLSERIEAVKF